MGQPLADEDVVAGVQVWDASSVLRAPPRSDEHAVDRYRATAVQERFWLLHELHRESPLCNEAVVFEIAGQLDETRLRLTLNRLVASHDALRTSFVQHGGTLEAEVAPADIECPLALLDLAASGLRDLESALDEQIDRVARARFDLTQPPLIRASLVRVTDERHVLVLVAHHTVIDGRSMFDLLPRQLAACYAATGATAVLQVGKPSPTYADFARHARAVESSPAAARDLEYWRALLDGAPGALDLPVDRRYPPRPSMRGVRAEHTLVPAMRDRVHELAQQLGVRPFDVTCAAFVAQLMRYSGQLDVVLGSPVANRGSRSDFADVVGCCIDTLLLRVRFDAVPTFEALARAIYERRRESNGHRSLSFGTLLDSLTAKRDPARNPLYQAMFNYMAFSIADVPFEELRVRAARRALATSMLDLSLDVTEQTGGYLLALEANADVFDAHHTERMLRHFMSLLDHALRAPQAPLGALMMLDDDEQRRADQLSRGPALDDPDPHLFHVELWQRAAAFAAAPALRSDQTALSYAALYERVVELARRLIDAGVKPGDFVLVRTMADPVDSVVAILGVLSAGGAFVPLDASNPLARQREMAEDSGARFLVGETTTRTRDLSTSGLVHVLINPGPARLRERGERAGRGTLPALPEVRGLHAGHPAYLLYTSGSTGRPKGVIVRHANLTHQLRARLARYPDAPGRILAPYSFAFDSSLASLSWTLAIGGELRLLAEAGRYDLARMREVIDRERITHFDAVPSLYAALLEGVVPRAFPELRVVICGGEALPAAVVNRHWQTLPHARLFNEYGPTEATVFATVHEIPRGTVEPATPIGRPIANSECRVFDAFGAEVPAGHSGELYIGGPGVAAGYHRRPQETASRFVHVALGQNPKVVLYRSGDRVRFRDDGLLEFLGRVDNQVQIRGHRVELGEIEAALCRTPGVTEAAAVLREDEHGETRLYGYVVAKAATSGPGSSLAALATSLRASLPSYMVPDVLVPLAALPLSANGKVDRSALPVVSAGVHATASFVAPRTELECDLVAIFEEVLGTSPLGARDNFFDRGGHSLLAVKLVDTIQRRTGHRVALADFAQDPTPEAIARRLEDGHAAPVARRCLDVLHGQGEGVAFVFVGSVAQARLLSQKLAPTRPMLAFNLFGLHEPGRTPDVDIDLVVDHYLRELRSVRPRGPYALGGYCADAKLAIAMARKLRDAGEQVPLLALIDAVFFVEQQIGLFSNGAPAVTIERPSDFDGGRLLNRVKRISMYGYEDVRRLLARGERRVRERLGLKVPLVLEHRMLFSNYIEALEAYRSPAIDGGRVALYLASEWGLREEHLSRMQDVDVREIRSYHESLFEGEQLLDLARAVEGDLSAADAVVGAALPDSRKAGRDSGFNVDN